MYQIMYTHGETLQEKRLYDPTTDEYQIVSGTLTLEAGKSGTLKLRVPFDNPAKADIKPLTDEIIVYLDGSEVFLGRAINTEEEFELTGVLDCEGVLSYLYDSVIAPYEFTGAPAEFLGKLILEHNAQVNAAKQFTLGTVTVEDPNDYINRSNTYPTKTLNEIDDKLLDSLGGYLTVRVENGVKYLDYLAAPVASEAESSVQDIRLGSNLIDIAVDVDYGDILTAVYPVGHQDEDTGEYLTVKDENNGNAFVVDEAAVKQFGWICAVIEWPDVTVPANLLRKAKQALAESDKVVKTITVRAVDLAFAGEAVPAFRLLDVVKVTSAPHGVETAMYIAKIKRDMVNPANDTFTFGAAQDTLTGADKQTRSSIRTRVQQITERTNILRNRLEARFESVNEFNEVLANSMGLYRTEVQDPNGGTMTYFHDKARLEDSNVVYTLREGGFAWTSAYKGDATVWEYGITKDGNAVLNAISAYHILADYIEAGLLSSVSGSTWINLDNDSFSFANGLLTYSPEKGLSITIKDGDINNMFDDFDTRLQEAKEAAQQAQDTADEASGRADALEQRADASDKAMDELTNRVTETETSIQANKDEIELRATKKEVEETYATKKEAQKAADAASEAQKSADAVNQSLSDFSSATNSAIEGLQSQIDGSISTWFFEYEPTNDNEPANGWTTTQEQNQHLGDLFYDTTTGYVYRWQVKDGVYSWERVQDTDVTKALQEAAKAQDTADSKRRVFYETPTPPYDKGDLWVQGKEGDILRCDVPKAADAAYSRSDWVLASKYTDDSAADAAQAGVDALSTRVTEAETKIEQNADAIELRATKTEVEQTYATKTDLDDTRTVAEGAVDAADEAQRTADEAQQAIDNLTITGVNLLLDTREGVPTWNSQNDAIYTVKTEHIDDAMTPSGRCEKLTYSKNASYTSDTASIGVWRDFNATLPKLIDGEVYTLSLCARADVPDDTTYSINYIKLSHGTEEIVPTTPKDITNKWQEYRYIGKWVATNRLTVFISGNADMPYSGDTHPVVYLSSYKLERGSIMNPVWTEAPEDITTSIKSVKEDVSSLSVKADEIESSVSSLRSTVETKADGSEVKTLTDRVTKVEQTADGIDVHVSKVEEYSRIAAALVSAKSLYSDVTFADGNNEVRTYNNASTTGKVKIVRETAQEDSPNAKGGSGYDLHVTHTGTLSPGIGGIYQIIQSRPNARFVRKIVAKLPKGSYMKYVGNPMGAGERYVWLTDNSGTGQFTEYMYEIICGATGEFKTGGHVYIQDQQPGDTPFEWYIAFCGTYDLTAEGIDSRVSKIEQTADGITSTVAQLQEDVSSKASQSEIEDLASRMTVVEQTAEGLTTRVTANETTIKSVQTIADTAASAAESAQSAADAAQDTADDAALAASGAQKAAESAQSTADGAKTAADSAQKTADGAKSAADSAQKTADGAQSAADGAQKTADGAKTTAEGAQSAAAGAQTAAESAQQTANGAQTAADNAQQTAEVAAATAGIAASTAEAAQKTAEQADNTANAAKDTADSVKGIADDAKSAADAATESVTVLTERVSSVEQTASGIVSRVEATETRISSLQAGGTNLAPMSTANGLGFDYLGPGPITSVYCTEELTEDQEYTCTLWGALAAPVTQFLFTVSTNPADEASRIGICEEVADGVFRCTGKVESFTQSYDHSMVWIFGLPMDAQGVPQPGHIDRIKIEKGNLGSDWSPAPEDVDIQITNFSTEISQMADSIDMKVQKGAIISEINQSAEKIKIQASKIDLQGAVTFESLNDEVSQSITDALEDAAAASELATKAGNSAAIATSASTTAQQLAAGVDNVLGQWAHDTERTYIDGGKIYTGTVAADQIAANAIVAGKIAAGAVTAGTIAAGAVSADQIAAGAVTADKLAADAIQSKNYDPFQYTGTKLDLATGELNAYNGINVVKRPSPSMSYQASLRNNGMTWEIISSMGESAYAALKLNGPSNRACLYTYNELSGVEIGMRAHLHKYFGNHSSDVYQTSTFEHGLYARYFGHIIADASDYIAITKLMPYGTVEKMILEVSTQMMAGKYMLMAARQYKPANWDFFILYEKYRQGAIAKNYVDQRPIVFYDGVNFQIGITAKYHMMWDVVLEAYATTDSVGGNPVTLPDDLMTMSIVASFPEGKLGVVDGVSP